MMPSRLTRPTVGLSPTRPQIDAGRDDRAVGLGADAERREARPRPPRPSPSSSRWRCGRARRGCASGRRARSSRSSSASSGCSPTRSGWSCRGSRRRRRAGACTRCASRGARTPSSASEPAVVLMRSPVAMLSLSSTGMPCSGPRGCRRARSASSAAAIASASGFSSITLCSVGPAVDRGDAREAVAHQALRRDPAVGHRLRQRRGARLLRGERRRRASGCGHEWTLESQQRCRGQEERASLHGVAWNGRCDVDSGGTDVAPFVARAVVRA